MSFQILEKLLFLLDQTLEIGSTLSNFKWIHWLEKFWNFQISSESHPLALLLESPGSWLFLIKKVCFLLTRVVHQKLVALYDYISWVLLEVLHRFAVIPTRCIPAQFVYWRFSALSLVVKDTFIEPPFDTGDTPGVNRSAFCTFRQDCALWRPKPLVLSPVSSRIATFLLHVSKPLYGLFLCFAFFEMHIPH